MQNLIDQLVATAVARVPADIRQAEAARPTGEHG
jgi:hypothetical protein